MAVRGTPYRQLSASAVYILVFCVFHFGLTTPLGFRVVPSDRIEHAIRHWIDLGETIEAVLLASLAALACALGARTAPLLKFRTRRRAHGEQPQLSLRTLPVLSSLLVSLSVIAWFWVVVGTGGWGLLVGSYRSLLDDTAS